MKWIMEHITPAGLVITVGVSFAAILTILLATDGPVQDFATEMINRVLAM